MGWRWMCEGVGRGGMWGWGCGGKGSKMRWVVDGCVGEGAGEVVGGLGGWCGACVVIGVGRRGSAGCGVSSRVSGELRGGR